jgi:hypothetical protein
VAAVKNLMMRMKIEMIRIETEATPQVILTTDISALIG